MAVLRLPVALLGSLQDAERKMYNNVVHMQNKRTSERKSKHFQ